MIMHKTVQKQKDTTEKNFDIVKQQLERKQAERVKESEMQRKAIEQRFKEDEFNKKLDLMEREKAQKTKRMYCETLNQQRHIRNSTELGNMSQRVGLDHSDLPDIHQRQHSQIMMPGIDHINSVGSKPL